MWTSNQQNLLAFRQAWLRRQQAGPERPRGERLHREASWYSTELIPPILDLMEQGYSPDDRRMMAEMLLQQGLQEEGDYVANLSEAEWASFVDFTLHEGAVKTAVVSERLKRAYTRLLEIVPEDVSMEDAQAHLKLVFERISEEFELTEEESNSLRDMTIEKWPRLEMTVEATRRSWMDDFIK